jgi:queuine tRNA-ribosyltransferase
MKSTAAMPLPLNTTLPAGLDGAPHFMPDATYGTVRATGADDLERADIRIVMTNSFHLMMRPGISAVRSLGGVKAFLGWNKVVATDSGGFQAYSLIRQNARYGRVTEDGLTFVPENDSKKVQLTPDKVILNQLRLGSDILFCLDDCTHPDDAASEQQLSVERTIAWARACKTAFEQFVERREGERPRLYGVVQGGRDPALRRRCAEELLAMGFDGFGYGGWPIDAEGALLHDMLALTRQLIPREFPMHALGVGHPDSIVKCARLGYALFDSALPTRDARRGRLYTFAGAAPQLARELRDWFRPVYIEDERYARDRRPLSEACTGICCTRYSRGYLRHLKLIEDGLFNRLATLHNLTFMSQLTSLLRLESCASP